MTAVSDDTLFLAASMLQAGRMGSTFEWALGEAIDNMDHFGAQRMTPIQEPFVEQEAAE